MPEGKRGTLEAVLARATAEISASLRGKAPVVSGEELHRQRLLRRERHRLRQTVLQTSFYPVQPAPEGTVVQKEYDPYGELRYRNGGRYRGD